MTEQATSKHKGSCHCGAVRFEVALPDPIPASRCNCTICHKLGAVGAIVKPEAFTLVAGAGDLSEYAWRSKDALRLFCTHCGVMCFGKGTMEQLGGAFVSINVNALDDVDSNQLTLIHWDGRHDNWQSGPRPAPVPIFAAQA